MRTPVAARRPIYDAGGAMRYFLSEGWRVLKATWRVARIGKYFPLVFAAGALVGVSNSSVTFPHMPIEFGRYFAERALTRLTAATSPPSDDRSEVQAYRDAHSDLWTFTYAVAPKTCAGAEVSVTIHPRGNATWAPNEAFRRCATLQASI